MSEYQYYEFQTIDRPLTSRKMNRLRAYSTRATITATRFVNHYEWGSFKGDPATWMEKYFDAFVYVANWGTHELALRLPRIVLDLKTARRYVGRAAASAGVDREFVVLTFVSEGEAGDDWDDDGTGWLSSIIPTRSDIVGGDVRALYLIWLLRAQEGEFGDAEPEPPVPPGLRTLSAPLKALVDFLRIDRDLIAIAVTNSAALATQGNRRRDLRRLITALPETEKTALLVRAALGEHAAVGAALSRQHRAAHHSGPPTEPLRGVGELLAAARRLAAERRQKAVAHAARQQSIRNQRTAVAREKYLADLAARQPATWDRIEKLIGTKQPAKYDEAVQLLCDLRDLANRSKLERHIAAHLAHIRSRHAKKFSFLHRLDRAGLLGESSGGV
jgi:hypothetical protein